MVANLNSTAKVGHSIADNGKFRRALSANEPAILGDIYQENTNIVIWKRELSLTLARAVDNFAATHPSFNASFSIAPNCARAGIGKSLAGAGQADLTEDIANLVEMFCYLFALKRVGLRLKVLDRAMCPRFHVDKVPCRLVTTYCGSATEWLPHSAVNRSTLGIAGRNSTGIESGLYGSSGDVQQLRCGDVALLKGELWEGNENAGLVHRSPAVAPEKNRLLLTLDFSD